MGRQVVLMLGRAFDVMIGNHKQTQHTHHTLNNSWGIFSLLFPLFETYVRAPRESVIAPRDGVALRIKPLPATPDLGLTRLARRTNVQCEVRIRHSAFRDQSSEFSVQSSACKREQRAELCGVRLSSLLSGYQIKSFVRMIRRKVVKGVSSLLS